jgi:hypothetical protein
MPGGTALPREVAFSMGPIGEQSTDPSAALVLPVTVGSSTDIIAPLATGEVTRLRALWKSGAAGRCCSAFPRPEY